MRILCPVAGDSPGSPRQISFLLCRAGLQEHPGLFQVKAHSREAFPSLGDELAGGLRPALALPESSQAHSGAQLQQFGAVAPGLLQGRLEQSRTQTAASPPCRTASASPSASSHDPPPATKRRKANPTPGSKSPSSPTSDPEVVGVLILQLSIEAIFDIGTHRPAGKPHQRFGSFRHGISSCSLSRINLRKSAKRSFSSSLVAT